MAVIYKRREISVELQTLFDGLTQALTLCAFFGILKTKGALMGFGNGTI